MQTIFLPNIQRLELENFSLYSTSPVIMDFSKSVSCIMGANGIGKSTLLNCINFAITGRINPPDKKLKSMEELETGNNYYLKYFDGRISEHDKDFATSTMVFSINENEILVKRSFFPESQIIEYSLNGAKQDRENFKTDIVRLTKLNNYAQFVFLQLKVLTFDEGRDCLFWNPSILTPTIFLCLGKNVNHADKADELARELLKLNSRIRNIQWDITKQNTRLNTLIEEKQTISDAEKTYDKEDEAYAKNEYEYVISCLEKSNTERDGFINERQLVYAKSSELIIEKLKLENEYEEIYAKFYSEKTNLRRNPFILELTSRGCPICKTVYSVLPSYVENSITKNVCPLCGENIETDNSTSDEIIDLLHRKDEEIKTANHQLEELIKRKGYIEQRIDELDEKIIDLSMKKDNIEQQNYKFLSASSSNDPWGERIKTLQESIMRIEKEKFANIEKRDQRKEEYDSLCHNLENIYQEVQIKFLPIFKKYAKEFTGLDLDMILNSVTDDGRRQFRFILQIDDTNRDNEFELSESQRFFIDIALRMAVVSFVCTDGFNSSMLIDTPEGSLDIAYETNAGSMFSEYIKSNQKMIITANLNSSGLIKTLAEKTKEEKFKLINMLNWAKLSSVQNYHFDLFSGAIEEIKKRLEG